MEAQIIIYTSKRKAAVITIAGILLAAMACLFFFRLNDAVFGWVFVISTAFVLTFGISSWFDRKPKVVLTGTGLTDLTATREEIEWNAILHADDFWYRGQNFVRLLVPVDYKRELLQPGWFWRLDSMYAREGVRALYIRVSGLDANSATLINLIKKRMLNENTNR